jgi:dephospho-CoA kinase
MYLVGLTGGIASGKSHVATLLSDFGASVIDADQVAREVVIPGSPGLRQIVVFFGEEVLMSSGELDRQKLGEIVFKDPAKRIQLEQILHPLIKKRTTQLIAEQETDLVVYAVPLLIEAKVDYPFDAVVTVEAGVENQISRLMSSRSMSEPEAARRIKAQTSSGEREAIADFIIDSSGTKEQTREQVNELWQNLVHLARTKS